MAGPNTMADGAGFTDQKFAVAIVGPTCSGKTAISMELSKLVECEIVSADSRQVYRLIDIGTAKPTADEMSIVPHHLVDIAPLDELVSAGVYGKLARDTVAEIFARHKLPLIVGGSGLYIRAIVDGLFDAPEIDMGIREELRGRLKSEGAGKLLEELKLVDPDAAKGLVPQNYKRILRALEVYRTSGKKISTLRVERTQKPDFETIQFGIVLERNELYRRIESRVDEMIAAGLIEEVKELLRRGFDPELNSLQTVGYKESIGYVQGKLRFEDMVSLIKMNTRRYAKRQLTWFRKDPRIIWLNADGKSAKSLAREIYENFESAPWALKNLTHR